MVQSSSWAANWFAASQEIPRISRNPKVHYRTHKSPPPVRILGQPNPIHIPTSHLLEIGPNIIHSSMPKSPQWSPSLRFPHQYPIHPLSSTIRATCPAHLILLDFITRTILGEQYKSFSSSLCNLLHSTVTSSFLGPNILLNTLFSNTLSFLSSRNVSDQASHPYETTGKIIVLYILIFKFSIATWKSKGSAPNYSKAFPDLNLLLISSTIQFWYVKVVPKYLNSSTLSKVLLSILTLWIHPASCILHGISLQNTIKSFIPICCHTLLFPQFILSIVAYSFPLLVTSLCYIVRYYHPIQ